MTEFFKKITNRGIKIARVNSILMTNLSICSYLLKFCTVLGSVVIEGDSPCIVNLLRNLFTDILNAINNYRRQSG